MNLKHFFLFVSRLRLRSGFVGCLFRYMVVVYFFSARWRHLLDVVSAESDVFRMNAVLFS